jgi:hypothetical protein
MISEGFTVDKFGLIRSILAKKLNNMNINQELQSLENKIISLRDRTASKYEDPYVEKPKSTKNEVLISNYKH